jgi:hypothetical protein
VSFWRAFAAVGALALAAGCGMLPAHPDAGPLIVPERYALAAESGGHLKHVGAPLPDGGTMACAACHDLQKNGFYEPGLDMCRDCHAERAGFHHGADAGLPDGGRVSCTSCHPFLGDVGVLPKSPWECTECHAQPMGKKQAIAVHGAACSYCHAPHRTPFTQPTECVACHPVDLVHGAPGETVAKTCMGCHQQHRPAIEATPKCLGCHSDPAKQRRAATRVDQSALFSPGHVSCGSCHKPHRFSIKEVKPCAACHQDKPVLAKALNPRAHQECTGCHAPHQPKSEPKACAECHAKLSSTHPVKDGLHACKSCHPPHAPLPPGAKAVTCDSCHNAQATALAGHHTFAPVTHGASDGGAVLRCERCHPPHAFAVAKGGGPALCRGCHREQHTLTATVKKAGHAACTGCHQGLPHQPGPKVACLSCHEEKQKGNPGHLECSKCHLPHDGKVTQSCTSCHAPAKLPGLHAVARHQQCSTCHTPHGPRPAGNKQQCLGACHKLPPRHDPTVERCTGCHLFVAPQQAPGLNVAP